MSDQQQPRYSGRYSDQYSERRSLTPTVAEGRGQRVEGREQRAEDICRTSHAGHPSNRLPRSLRSLALENADANTLPQTTPPKLVLPTTDRVRGDNSPTSRCGEWTGQGTQMTTPRKSSPPTQDDTAAAVAHFRAGVGVALPARGPLPGLCGPLRGSQPENDHRCTRELARPADRHTAPTKETR